MSDDAALVEEENEGGGTDEYRQQLYDREARLRMYRGWDKDIASMRPQWVADAKMWFSLIAGDQWEQEAIAQLEEELRVPTVFNVTAPYVDAITGAELTNQHETAFYPREVGDAAKAETVAAIMDWAREESDANDEESAAALDALVCGLGWIEQRLDPTEDGTGKQIIWDNVDTFEMAQDPMAKKPGLDDARYVRRVREMTKDEFLDMFPEAEFVVGGEGEDSSGLVKHNYPNDAYEESDPANDNADRKTVQVKEYQWWRWEPFAVRFIDPINGQQADLPLEQYEQMNARLPFDLGGEKLKRKCYYRAYIASGNELGFEKLPVTGFTYRALTGKYDKVRRQWYGVVRAMVDPQRFGNKLFSQILNMIDKSPKGGNILEEDAVDDIEEFNELYASSENVTVASGTVSGKKIMPKPPVVYPQHYRDLMQFSFDIFPRVTGVNPNLFGMQQEAGESGILDAQRTRQAYGVISWFFASLKRYRKASGRFGLQLLQFLPPGTLARVVSEGNVKYIPVILGPDVARMDVVVDDSPTAPNEKDRVFAVFAQLFPMLQKANLPPQFWAEIAKYMPLPATLNEKIAAALMQPNPQQQQAAQMQQAAAQAEIQKTQSEAVENQSQTVLNQAKAAEIGGQMQLELLNAIAPGVTGAQPRPAASSGNMG